MRKFISVLLVSLLVLSLGSFVFAEDDTNVVDAHCCSKHSTIICENDFECISPFATFRCTCGHPAPLTSPLVFNGRDHYYLCNNPACPVGLIGVPHTWNAARNRCLICGVGGMRDEL